MLVPEDSVRPETLTLVVLIRRKGLVDGFALLPKELTSFQLTLRALKQGLRFCFMFFFIKKKRLNPTKQVRAPS